ncbi:hypothetical protein JCM11641_000184 [Rhodosporidiobolus odoratus]
MASTGVTLADPARAPPLLGGVLSVRLVEARKLPLSAGSAGLKHGAAASLDAKTVGAMTGEGTCRASSGMSRREKAALPYVNLTFDKNEVAVDAIDGASSPGRDPLSHRRAKSVSAEDVPVAAGQMQEKWTVRGKAYEAWVPASTGSGEFHLQLSFQAGKNKPLTVDDFELLKVIGKGSFGKVMQVRKKDTGRNYAMKTIRKAHIVGRSEGTHTLAERTVLAQVRSGFIVPLKFCFQSKEKLYLVLSYANGGELFHHLQAEGRFSEDRSRFYAAELLSALDCLYQSDIVYRDLKPENILLDYTGHLVLCDSGLTKLNMG